MLRRRKRRESWIVVVDVDDVLCLLRMENLRTCSVGELGGRDSMAAKKKGVRGEILMAKRYSIVCKN